MSNSRARTIAQVASYYNPASGSFIPAMTQLARRLISRGDRMVFLTPDVHNATWCDRIAESGANLIRVSTARELSATLKSLQPDIIHTHFTRFDISVCTAGLSQARRFWHIHSWPDANNKLSIFRTFIKYNTFGRFAEAFIADSYALADEFASRGVARTKLRVIPNGIDCGWFRPPTDSERRDARASFGFTNERVILFFGRDTNIKGGDLLWQALEDVPDLSMLLVGANEPDTREFEKRASVVAISRTENPRSLYWAADLLVLPSRREGFSFVLAEAASTELPIVASNIPPVLEVTEGMSGVKLFPIDNPKKLAELIPLGLSFPRSPSAREQVERRYSLDRWVDEIVDLYNR